MIVRHLRKPWPRGAPAINIGGLECHALNKRQSNVPGEQAKMTEQRRIPPTMEHRRATERDIELLGRLNQELIRDEGHRNPMSVHDLVERMSQWLAGDYTAILFEENGAVVAYALYCEKPDEVHLRQLFVVRDRRRNGIGRQSIEILRSEIWPKTKRLTVDVLVRNEPALAFWRAVGYRDYSLTLEIMPGVVTP
jgi:GNAT superfamily N-acetyltransferase